MTILDSTGGEFVTQFLKSAAEGITDKLFNTNGLTEGKARASAQAAAEAEGQERDRASITAAHEALATYRSTPRRTVEAIAGDIQKLELERSRLLNELSVIEREIQAGSTEPNTDTATRHLQIQLTLKSFAGRLQRLEAEKQDVERFQLVDEYLAAVSAEVTMARELRTFEASDEWRDIQAAYHAGFEKINRLRSTLRAKPISRRDALEQKYGRDAVRGVGEQLDAIDSASPELHGVIWR